MSAACNGAVDTYQSFPGQSVGWYPTCGTSEATPLFAGVIALADQLAGHPLGVINPAIYALSASHAAGIVDITKGNNTVSWVAGKKLQTVNGYRALKGYDMASGVGTVNAAKFVPELVWRNRSLSRCLTQEDGLVPLTTAASLTTGNAVTSMSPARLNIAVQAESETGRSWKRIR